MTGDDTLSLLLRAIRLLEQQQTEMQEIRQAVEKLEHQGKGPSVGSRNRHLQPIPVLAEAAGKQIKQPSSIAALTGLAALAAAIALPLVQGSIQPAPQISRIPLPAPKRRAVRPPAALPAPRVPARTVRNQPEPYPQARPEVPHAMETVNISRKSQSAPYRPRHAKTSWKAGQVTLAAPGLSVQVDLDQECVTFPVIQACL